MGSLLAPAPVTIQAPRERLRHQGDVVFRVRDLVKTYQIGDVAVQALRALDLEIVRSEVPETQPLEGRVRLVEPAGFTKVSALGVDEQRVNVIVDLSAPRVSLGDGYRLDARIVTWRSERVMTAPVSALIAAGAGDRVALFPSDKLVDGSRVHEAGVR